MPGRHRWVDYKEHDFNAPQIEPIWHSWLNHIRQDPPNIDPIVEASRKTWEIVSRCRASPLSCFPSPSLFPRIHIRSAASGGPSLPYTGVRWNLVPLWRPW